MRLLHTADWHLGHALHRFRREAEHQAFLDWLVGALQEHGVDALLIAGDIFDTANPPTSALRSWYRFLAEVRRACPDLDVVVIGGNHDAAARLDAPAELLDATGVHMVGGLPTDAQGQVLAERMVAPLRDRSGAVAAWVLAVPFLRMADLDAALAPVDGVAARYAQAAEAARQRQQPGQALIAMGHAYLTGTALSELSERKVLGGNQHALPTSVFPADAAYVALGHMHLAQQVGAPHIRYSGSPLPLSFGERTYRHQVLLVDLDGADLVGVTPLPVPRAVDLIAVPEGAAEPLPQVLQALRALPAADDLDGEAPFIEVRVRLDKPEAALREQVDLALEGRAARLVRIVPTYTGQGPTLAASVERGTSLSDLDPVEVFRQKWAQSYETPPDDAVLAAFHEAVDAAQQRGGA